MDYLIENGHAYRTGNTKTGTFKIYKAPEKRLEILQVDNKLEVIAKDYLDNILPLPKDLVVKENEVNKPLKDVVIDNVLLGESKQIKAFAIGYSSTSLLIENKIIPPTVEERMTSLEKKIDLLISLKDTTTKY